MVDLELDAPLESPVLKPPLAYSASPKDNEPDDLDKIRQWQEERLSRKLRGEYESAILHLGELIENNAAAPLNIAAVRVEGATHTRQSFLGSIIKPHLPSPFVHSASTLQSVLLKARNIGHTLQATDLFQSVHAVVEPSRDPVAAADDVDLIFKTKEKGRFMLKTSTEFGNDEGSVNVVGRVRNVFGGAEVLEGQFSFGNKTKKSFHASLTAPLTSSLLTHGTLSAFNLERDNSSYASCSEALHGLKAVITSGPAGGHEFGYEWVLRHLGYLKSTASMSMRHAAGSSIKSSLFHNWTKDTRDDKVMATRGAYFKLSQELAGLGGDASFYKAEAETQCSRKVVPNVTLSFAARTGVLWSLFSPTYFSDRFQMGGPTSIRMFRNNSMGPRDGSDSLGGELYWSAGLSLISDIPKKPNWPVKTHLFINCGRLDNIDKTKSLATNVQECIMKPCISAGVGVIYRFDPLRVEVNFGVPLVANKSDGHRRGFEVGIGINFL